MLSHFSHVQLFVTLWIVASQLFCPWDPLGKNTGVGCHALLPPPGDLPHAGIKAVSPVSLALQADSLPLSHHLYTYPNQTNNKLFSIFYISDILLLLNVCFLT